MADPPAPERSGAVLAIDVGGTKLAVGIVGHDGRILERARTPTPAGAGVDAETIWSALEAAVSALPGVERVAAVGVGCGGPMSWPAGRVSPLNMRAWREFPLRQRLQERFPDVAVRLHNDAVCFVAAEHWRGAGVGVDNLLAMVVSTGVGAGVVLGGRLIDGRTGNAGHVGHVVVDPLGPVCRCGGWGCLEAIARGAAVVGWAVENGWQPSGDGSASALAADARAGDRVAVAAFERAGRAVGIALASAAALLDIALVVVGGGLAQAGDLLFGPLRIALQSHAQVDFLRDLAVVPAQLGQDAGLVGAAALVLESERYWSASG